MKDLSSVTVQMNHEEVAPGAIRQQVERIIASNSFRTSRRYPRFLQYIVEKSLSGESEGVKERLIGADVFERPFDYDVTSDPIVRVAAGEIRKRLAQYYVQEGHELELRIELPPGSYVPHFHWPRQAVAPEIPAAEVAEPDPTPNLENEIAVSLQPELSSVHPQRWTVLIWIAAAIFIVAGTGWWWFHLPASNHLDDLWAPIVENGTSTVLCVGDLNSVMDKVQPEEDEDLVSAQKLRNHVGPNDAGALARVAGLLGSKKRKFTVVLADSATLTDLHVAPAVLIGAFDNSWTQKLLADQRFQLVNDENTGIRKISDSQNPKRQDWEISAKTSVKRLDRDFALISRIVSPSTGQEELVLAGLGPYGTVAATEFVTDPIYFQEFLRKAPRGWVNHDLQIVIYTDVVNGRSGAPHVLDFVIR